MPGYARCSVMNEWIIKSSQKLKVEKEFRGLQDKVEKKIIHKVGTTRQEIENFQKRIGKFISFVFFMWKLLDNVLHRN